MQCPTCDLPLRPGTVDGELFDSCERCGGEYFSHHAFRELLLAHTQPPGVGGSYRRPSPLSDPIRYRKCPSCGEPMLRRNFLETSGVIVDVCGPHGIWLDRGERTTLIEFALTGAMAGAERRMLDRAETINRLDAWGDALRAATPAHYWAGIGN